MKSKNLWRKIKSESTPGTTPLHPSFFTSLNKNDLVLEIGSGSGRVIDICIEKRLRCVGFDVNPNEIESLKVKYKDNKNVTVMEHDITKSSLPKIRGAKAAIMLGLLGALDSTSQRLSALENTLSALDEKGYIFVSEFLYDDSIEELKERYEKGRKLGLENGSFLVEGGKDGTSYITHNFLKEELERVLSTHCTIVDVKITNFTTFHGNIRPGILVVARRK